MWESLDDSPDGVSFALGLILHLYPVIPNMVVQDQKKVLVPAFSRCFKDPFWKSRHAAVMAMAGVAPSLSVAFWLFLFTTRN